MARIYIPSLKKEYREALKQGEMQEADVEKLFHFIKNNFHKQKRMFILCCVMVIVLMGGMGGLSLMNMPAAGAMQMEALIVPTIIMVLILVGVLFFVYFFVVRRILMQFHKCLEIGYPNLVDTYGYQEIKAPIIK